MGFEIHVLAIVNELYFRRLQTADTPSLKAADACRPRWSACVPSRTSPYWPTRLSCPTLACAAAFLKPGTAKSSPP